MRNVSLIVLAAVLTCTVSPAQFQFGSVVGLIKDASQAPVPGATIEIRSQSTNVARQAISSTAGEYNFVSLPPDKYTITVKHPGFRDTSRALELSVGQRLEADITLEVGDVTTKLIVEAETPLLEVASSELGNVRSEKQVEDLPLNTRNFTQLVALAPGVNNRGGASNSILQGYTSGRGVNGAVINGAPPEGVVYMFDGVQSVDNDAGMIIFFPPVDAIQEFKVQTSAAPRLTAAARASSTWISSPARTHSTARRTSSCATPPSTPRISSTRHAKPIPPFRLNQFGFNLGGPVFIPKVFNGKDKLFFFADYEGKRVYQAQTFTSTVPIAAFHTGDFSALLPKTVIFDPRGNGHTPLPNNIIPLSAIDPDLGETDGALSGPEPAGHYQQLPLQSGPADRRGPV